MKTLVTRALLATTMVVIALQSVGAQKPAEVRVPKSVLQKYTGEWIYPDGNTVMLRLVGETLYREIPGQRVPLVPISETLFRLGPVFTAEFVMDQSGGISQILTDGSATEYRLRRKGSRSAVLPSDAVAAVQVPRAVLERYVGVYEYIPGQMKRTDLRIMIRLKGDVLVRETPGQEDDVLTPLSETRFKVGNTTLRVEFVVDEAGVTQVLGSGGQQMLARLISKR